MSKNSSEILTCFVISRQQVKWNQIGANKKTLPLDSIMYCFTEDGLHYFKFVVALEILEENEG